MPDIGHQLTDEMLEDLEKRIAREYAVAVKDMRRKLREYLKADEEKREEQKRLYQDGKITRKEYRDWCVRHEMMGQRWRDMRDVLAEDLQHASDIALRISRNSMADVYALNANYATYQIEHDFRIDTGFTLYDHDTAEYLLKDQRQLMPGPSTKKAAQIAADKSLQWNKQKIQSAVLQGILQGESSFEIAKRLQSVAQMDYNASVRYARTMTTSAENAGRYEAYRRAKGLGVDLTIEWQATLDGRTRHDHRLMHGQRREIDEPFKTPDGFEILYPADCSGDSYALQGEIWNCRCTLIAWVKGFEEDTVKDAPGMEGMSFEEWQQAKAPKEKREAEKPAENKEVKNVFANVKGLDEEFTKAMSEKLAGCNVQEAKDWFAHYADELVCVEDNLKSGAFFSRSDGGIHIGRDRVMNGDSIHLPMEDAFHEFGHMTDWLANGKSWKYLSNTEIEGKRLLDVIKSDFKAFKKACGVTRAEDVIPILQAENMSKSTRGNISDILEKCTHKSYPLGVGHGASYHDGDFSTEKEFFAEVLDSSVANPDSYAQMQRLFPKSVDFVWSLIKGAMNK